MEEDNKPLKKEPFSLDEIEIKKIVTENKKTNEEKWIDKLNSYEPLDIKTFIGQNVKTNDKFWFYKKNYKQIIPFLFRKNRKIDFTDFIVSKSKYINDIKNMTKRLDAYYKDGTQIKFVEKTKKKKLIDVLNKFKYFFSLKNETYEEYRYRKLLGRLSLYQQKVLLMQQFMDIDDKIKHGFVNNGILKERQKIMNNIEKIKIKIYEAQNNK